MCTQVHWFSIVNSVIVVLIMAGLVAFILIRTVRRDLSKYEQLVVDSSGLEKEEAGWKLVSGDVFRAPNDSMSLAMQVHTTLNLQHTHQMGQGISPAARQFIHARCRVIACKQCV